MLTQFFPFGRRNTFSYTQMILCLIIFTVQLIPTCAEYQYQHQQMHSHTFEQLVMTYLSHGTMNNAYLNFTEYIECLNVIATSFPNLTALD